MSSCCQSSTNSTHQCSCSNDEKKCNHDQPLKQECQHHKKCEHCQNHEA